jgi:kojibiose phosphorylase
MLDVLGPDEYHERINNNHYTNLIVRKVLEQFLHYSEFCDGEFDDLAKKVERFLKKLYVPTPNRKGLIEQFDGYFKLKRCSVPELLSQKIKPNEYLGGSGLAGQTQIIKQADVILALSLFEENEKILSANYDYYSPLTEHGSSLSSTSYGIVAAKIGRYEEAFDHFLKSVSVDYDATAKSYAGNTYIGGSHPASMGGAYLMLKNGFLKNRSELVFSHQNRQIRMHINPQIYRAVIFDLDGVLLSTDEYHYLAWKKLADRLNLKFDRSLNNNLRGISREKSFEFILKHNNVSMTKELIYEHSSAKNEYYKEYIRNELNPKAVFARIKELLVLLRDAGIKLAVGSSSQNTFEILKKTDLYEAFDVVVGGGSFLQSKPFPDIFNYAQRQLGTNKNNCLIIEDASVGIEAGQRAGIDTVLLGNNLSYPVKSAFHFDSTEDLYEFFRTKVVCR